MDPLRLTRRHLLTSLAAVLFGLPALLHNFAEDKG